MKTDLGKKSWTEDFQEYRVKNLPIWYLTWWFLLNLMTVACVSAEQAENTVVSLKL